MSWDIVFWTNENTVDYLPSCWGNDEKSKYKYPVGPKMSDQRKRALINECANLQIGQYIWCDAQCKKSEITNLEIAKKLCERGQYTSSLETDDNDESDEGNSRDTPALSTVTSKRRKTDNCQEIDQADVNHLTYERPIFNTLPLNSLDYQEHQPNNVIIVDIPPNTTTSAGSNTTCVRCDLLAAEIVSIKHTINEKFQRLETLLLSIASQEQATQHTSTTNIENLMNMEVENDVINLENQIDKTDFKNQLETYFFLIGGPNIHKCIYNILKKLFSPQMTLKFSAMGKGEKKSFIKLKCYEVLKAAVRRRFLNATEQEINNSIIKFFVSAKDRIPKKINSCE